MNEQTVQFRSAAFGGFHRQDVLDHVEKLTKEKQELVSRLEQESEARTQAEARLSQAEEAAKEEKEAQEAMSGELEYLRNELEVRSAALAKTEEENRLLRAQVETLRPGAEAWEHIKEQAGTIEVSAHERAQVTIQDARERVVSIQEEGAKWVRDLQAGSDRLQAALNASIQAAEEQLDTARQAFRNAERGMRGYQASLARLVEEIEQNAPSEEPEPQAEGSTQETPEQA